MLRRYMLYAAGFVALTICAFRCEVITGPNFPDEPKISFRDIKKYRIVDRLGNTNDSISIALKFQDGNGDLGLTQEEIDNKAPLNYIVIAYQQVNGEWIEKEFEPALSGRFPTLNPGKEGPIEGTLSYGVRFPVLIIPQNTIFKFKIYILDRNGNRSNEIETSEITINEK